MDDQVVGALADIPLQEGQAGGVLVAQIAVERYGGGPVRAGRMGAGEEEIRPALARANSIEIISFRLQVGHRDRVDILAAAFSSPIHEYGRRANEFFLESLPSHQCPTVGSSVQRAPGHC